MKITHVIGREIYNSRGMPTIECELVLDNSVRVRASAPSGLSVSSYEAQYLYDGGERLMGYGVRKAIQQLENIIAPAIIGREPDLIQMDVLMLHLDNTENKSNLGANTLIAASMAICRAHAINENMPLYEFIAHICGFESVGIPGPMFNMINGGMHANNNLIIQECMVVPIGMSSFEQAMQAGATIFQTLKQLLKQANKSTAVGDEGGFASNFDSPIEALDYLMGAIRMVEREFEGTFMLSLDIAASQLYNPEQQIYRWGESEYDAAQLISWYQHVIKQYPIYSIEDPFSEHDWKSWKIAHEILSPYIKVVGDDIFATNPQRIWDGIEQHTANAIIIKPNQIGTITETLQAIKLCKEYNIHTIVSHRSGETNDDFIADLAIGTSAEQIKAGGCSRGERMAKYNRLLTIEQELLHNIF